VSVGNSLRSKRNVSEAFDWLSVNATAHGDRATFVAPSYRRMGTGGIYHWELERGAERIALDADWFPWSRKTRRRCSVPDFRGCKRVSTRVKFPTLSDPYARDGHRFESPQLHQEVLISGGGSNAPKSGPISAGSQAAIAPRRKSSG
jgi:hypothetical protein